MPSFEIVELDKAGKPHPFPAGVYPDGKTASSVLAVLQARFPDKKLQPRPIKDETNDWRAREARRFDEGIYQPLGWDLPPIPDHFAYRALKNPKNVAYTPSPEYGKTDKQATVHVNAYLNKFYPGLDIETRRKLVWDYCGEDLTLGFEITQEGDKIEWIYKNGPHSCMAYDLSEFASSIHPARVYAGPDLGIAFILDESGTRVTARSVVWPDKKVYSTTYGDATKLVENLTSAGYTRGRSNEFDGARLSSEEDSGDYDGYHYEGYLCPYIDTHYGARWDGQYLILDNDGSIRCQSTSGIAYTNYREIEYDEDPDY